VGSKQSAESRKQKAESRKQKAETLRGGAKVNGDGVFENSLSFLALRLSF
jgi:hypothetical protein